MRDVLAGLLPDQGAGAPIAPAAGVQTWTARQPLLFTLAAFVLLWTAYEIIAHGAGDVHNDMAEAYAWGKELQAGYFKHPPFWAWLTYAWFQVFPVEDWSAYLFSVLNSAVGIYLVSRCARFFIEDRRAQTIAATLLILIPAYTFHAMKMNANTVHLSVWPGIALAFLTTMERPRAGASLLLGLLASCALLSKYNALIFLGCVFAASLAHPNRQRFWLSFQPLLVILGALPLAAVHGWWLWRNDFLPFTYFAKLQSQTGGSAGLHGLLFIGAEILYAAPALLVLALLGWRGGMVTQRPVLTPMNRVLLILALGPMLLTALFGVMLHTRSPALWGLQNLFLIPVLALRFVRTPDLGKLQRQVAGAVMIFLLGAVIVSPVVAWAKFYYGDRAAVDPRSQLARELTAWWRAAYDMPLRIVGGDENYALAATFYSPDHPSYYRSADRRLTPWITDTRLREGGALLICNEFDETCEQEAARASASLGDEKKISAVKEFLGQYGQNKNFTFFVIPPRRGKTDDMPK